jgi:ribosomal protein S18 acetylase RimI-like enzyme
MPAPLTFRPASADDRGTLLALQWRSSLGNPNDREALLANPDAIDIPAEQLTPGQCVIAVMNETDVGFAIVVKLANGDADLDGLFVDPAYWKLGIGRALCGEARNLATAMGCRALQVVANPQALDFYRSLGFEVVGEAQTRFATAPLMRLKL